MCDLVPLEEGGPYVPRSTIHPAPSGNPAEWDARTRACIILQRPNATREELHKALNDLVFATYRE
jgi:hypothetical protein